MDADHSKLISPNRTAAARRLELVVLWPLHQARTRSRRPSTRPRSLAAPSRFYHKRAAIFLTAEINVRVVTSHMTVQIVRNRAARTLRPENDSIEGWYSIPLESIVINFSSNTPEGPTLRRVILRVGSLAGEPHKVWRRRQGKARFKQHRRFSVTAGNGMVDHHTCQAIDPAWNRDIMRGQTGGGDSGENRRIKPGVCQIN